jgi:hypothetical protein
MPLSEEEEARLLELGNEIKDLKKDIKDYKAKVPEDEVILDKHVNYLTPLNNRLYLYESEARELRVKASAPPQQGK